MPKQITPDYNQQHFLPCALEDWIGPRHPARLVREVVEGVLAAERERPSDDPRPRFTQPAAGNTGRPAYSTALLLGLWLYGYMTQVRSTRDLEAAARDQMGFVWLCGNQAPDHNTLWRFWEANAAALRGVFRTTIDIAMDLKLLGLVVQAVDGTKIQAACSSSEGWDQAKLEALLVNVDQRLDELETAVKNARVLEAQLPTELVLGELVKTGQLRGKVLDLLTQMQIGNRKHGHPGEPDAHRVKLATGGKPLGYNAQAVVDAKARIIVAADLTSQSNDLDLAVPMIEQAEANTDGGSAEALSLADGGYATTETLRLAEENARPLLCPLPSSSKNAKASDYHASKFTYQPLTDTVSCPQGRSLPFMSVRLRGVAAVPTRIYRSAATCQGCPVRHLCTRDRHGRSIDIRPGTAAMERHRLRLADPANVLTLKLRKQIVEPVFGWIKAHDNFRRFTLRGLHKAGTQWKFVCAARNLRTLTNAWFDAHAQHHSNLATP